MLELECEKENGDGKRENVYLLWSRSMDLIVLSVLLILLIFIGVREQKRNDENVEKIPLRVNVNGIRGKSTATRLISAVLIEAGYKNIGKTTGTAPRFIYGNKTSKELEIMRRPKGVSIIEQLGVIEKAANLRADSLVCECMAVNPQLQEIYQEKMIKANIGVIVNVLEDHLDEMGPTMDQIALAFTSTIPYNGKVIISQQDVDYIDYFKKIAKERNTEVFVTDESEIPEGFLEKFKYVVFPNNVAIPLAFAKAVGIDKETALRGMLKANPDPGALMVDRIEVDGKSSVFVNAFAANEPASTLEIWNTINEMGYAEGMDRKPLVVFNARPDRVDRTKQFVDDCIPFISDDLDLLAMGEVTSPLVDGIKDGTMPNVDKYYDLEFSDAKALKNKIYELMDGRVVFYIGNIHGVGEEFLEEIAEWYGEERKPGIRL